MADKRLLNEDTTVLKAYRQAQLQDRWSIITCLVCQEKMKNWLIHVIIHCQCPQIDPQRREMEAQAGGSIQMRTEWLTRIANTFEEPSSRILGTLIMNWTNKRKEEEKTTELVLHTRRKKDMV